MDSFLGNFPGFGKGPNLESSRIGQDGAVPAAEAMKSTHFLDDVLTRTQPQVVGIAENDFGIEKAQFLGMKGLDRALGSDGHEYGGLDRAMSSGETTASGLGGGVGGEKLEHWLREV